LICFYSKDVAAATQNVAFV